MYMTFRWYGADDPVTLQQIRQIPVIEGIVTSLYDVPTGALWDEDELERLKAEIEDAGLRLSVIESLPVHEDIKLGRPTRDQYIEAYCENLRRVADIGVPVVCYNFMPLFDWFRTDLAMPLSDGSTALSYDHTQLEGIGDPFSADLPAWMPVDSPDELKAAYHSTSPEALWDHLAYFLEHVIPTAEAVDIRMGLHPDDPPWSIYGLPRIITDEAALDRVLKLVDSPANGLTFCTGSLGAHPANDLPTMIRQFGHRIHFAHCRNVRITGPQSFHESAHPSACGSVDMAEVMRAYHDVGFDGPMRPDHGRMVWGETGIPGYGLYDRALGATYLVGLWEGLSCKRTKALVR